MTKTTAAASRLDELLSDGPAAEVVNALGISALIDLDNGAHRTLIPATTRPLDQALVSSDDIDAESSPLNPAVTIHISSDTVIALADGQLDTVQALTQRRFSADGPIFAALGVIQAITKL